jgi:hypothetical protein
MGKTSQEGQSPPGTVEPMMMMMMMIFVNYFYGKNLIY